MARQEGLDEQQVAAIDDNYASSALKPAEIAALRLTDAIVGDPRSLSASGWADLRAHYSEAQIAELALGVGLFLSLSKVLITLGLEPESMSTTIVATPGSKR